MFGTVSIHSSTTRAALTPATAPAATSDSRSAGCAPLLSGSPAHTSPATTGACATVSAIGALDDSASAYIMDSANRPAPARTRAACVSHVTGASGPAPSNAALEAKSEGKGAGERRRQARRHRETGAEDDLQSRDVMVAHRSCSGAGPHKSGFQRRDLRGARIQLGFRGGGLRRPFAGVEHRHRIDHAEPGGRHQRGIHGRAAAQMRASRC